MIQKVHAEKSNATIRPAEQRDLPAIVEIYNHYVRTSSATFDTNDQTLDERRQWFDNHEKAGLPVFVAEENGNVIGWQSLSFYHSRCAYKQTVESSTYIAPSYHGKGLGRRLLETAIEAASQRGFHCIVGLISSENANSIELVKKCGFEVIGTLKEVGFKFDRWLDVTIVQKMLRG